MRNTAKNTAYNVVNNNAPMQGNDGRNPLGIKCSYTTSK